jgi:hypothetical protein
MASNFVKYNAFVGDLCNKVHNLSSDYINACLSNNVAYINVALLTKSQLIGEVASGNGYTTGGLPTGANSLVASAVNSSGTFTLTGTNQTWTGGASAMGAFRYIILYNSSPTNGPLICYWDYGSSLTLNPGDSFTVEFDGGASSGTIFTLA